MRIKKKLIEGRNMSKRRKTTDFYEKMLITPDIYEEPKNIKLHSSELFFVKGHNGVLLRKMPVCVSNICILDSNLEEMPTNHFNVYYFDNDDEDKILLVELEDGDYEEFVFSSSANDFVKRKSKYEGACV